MNINQFTYMCKLSQKNLKKYAYSELSKTHKQIIEKDGFIYAIGDYPVLLVAHLDTVHKHLPKQIDYDKNLNTLSSVNGLGADDRCGVYMILELVKKYNCSVVFCENEEIGGIGADKFTRYILDNRESDIDNWNFAIEIDRQGKNDAVFYSCDNPEFEQFITDGYFTTNYGTFSDISIICPDTMVAGVNLSCGYYRAHTTSEYVKIDEFDSCLSGVIEILDRVNTDTKFEYIEEVYKKSSYYDGWYDDFDEYYYLITYYDGTHERVECVIASTFDEAIGKFMGVHTRVCFADIVDVVQER